jgi:hypothetical protein
MSAITHLSRAENRDESLTEKDLATALLQYLNSRRRILVQKKKRIAL